jgi:hypothetical protein
LTKRNRPTQRPAPQTVMGEPCRWYHPSALHGCPPRAVVEPAAVEKLTSMSKWTLGGHPDEDRRAISRYASRSRRPGSSRS